MFAQTLGGALFISVAQNIFTNRLLGNLAFSVPNLDASIVLKTGATSLKDAITRVNPNYLPNVLLSYNKAIDQTFYLSVAMASLSLVGALGVEWKSVKGKKIESIGA